MKTRVEIRKKPKPAVLKLNLALHKANSPNFFLECLDNHVEVSIQEKPLPWVFIHLTPKEARRIATKMLQMADHIEKPVEHYSRVIKIRRTT